MLARGAFLGGLGVLVVATALSACGSSNGAANGGECFVTTDCQAPFVCVEQKDKTRKCTDNLDSVVGKVPPEAGLPMGDAGAQAEGGGGPQEAGPQTPVDSGSGTGGDQ